MRRAGGLSAVLPEADLLLRSESGVPARTMDPFSERLMEPADIRSVGSSLADLEDAVGALGPIAGAPSGNKGGSQGGVVEVDRDCVVQRAAQTCRRHRPAIGPQSHRATSVSIEAIPEGRGGTPTLIRTGKRRSVSLIARRAAIIMQPHEYPIGLGAEDVGSGVPGNLGH